MLMETRKVESVGSMSRARETSSDARLQAQQINTQSKADLKSGWQYPWRCVNPAVAVPEPPLPGGECRGAGIIFFFFFFSLTSSLTAFISPCKKTRQCVPSGRWKRKRRSSSGSEYRGWEQEGGGGGCEEPGPAPPSHCAVPPSRSHRPFAPWQLHEGPPALLAAEGLFLGEDAIALRAALRHERKR